MINLHKVATRVYTTNPIGIAILVAYIIGLIIFIFNLMSMSTTEIGIVCALFFGVWIYVYYGNNPKWRMQVWDERRLVFSSTSIDFGEDHYPVSEMETAAIYLESFDGFRYRGVGIPAGGGSGAFFGRKLIRNQGIRSGILVEKRADGENNKISFRHGGETEDFTFYLDSYAQYAGLRAVMNDWSLAGVNVVFKPVFEDEFIQEEMRYFNDGPG